MPVCGQCGRKSSTFAKIADAPTSIACEHCSSSDTHRIISRIAVHRSELSKIASLDPRYHRMAEDAMKNTPEGDPDTLLRKMTPYSAADD